MYVCTHKTQDNHSVAELLKSVISLAKVFQNPSDQAHSELKIEFEKKKAIFETKKKCMKKFAKYKKKAAAKMERHLTDQIAALNREKSEYVPFNKLSTARFRNPGF